MEKITILCGMKDYIDGYKFMCDVAESLEHLGCCVRSVISDTLVLNTEHTQTAFIYDISKQPLNGVKADAIFGKEPYKQKLAPYLKEFNMYNMQCGLVDYIHDAEVKARFGQACEEFDKQIYITTARSNGKTAFMKEMEKCLHKDEFVYYSKADCDITRDFWNKITATNSTKEPLPEIKNVIFNNPATIVFWADGTKTVVQCQGDDIYDPEKGLAMAMCKKMLGNKHEYYHTFKHWMKKV